VLIRKADRRKTEERKRRRKKDTTRRGEYNKEGDLRSEEKRRLRSMRK
jgi:hypothetical protein